MRNHIKINNAFKNLYWDKKLKDFLFQNYFYNFIAHKDISCIKYTMIFYKNNLVDSQHLIKLTFNIFRKSKQIINVYIDFNGTYEFKNTNELFKMIKGSKKYYVTNKDSYKKLI